MSEKKKINYIAPVKAIILSVAITLIFILIITCICYFGNISEKVLGLMLFLASAVSVFLSCLLMAKKLQHAGLLYGAVAGFGYFLVILGASACISGSFSPSTQALTMLIGSVLSGALGGVIGVNK